MPNRLVCLAILVAWALATFELIRHDILPDLLIGPPPDLRAIARAQQVQGEGGWGRWAILVADDADAINFRAVGQVETRAHFERDGWYRMTSYAWLDAAELLRGTSLAVLEDDRLEVRGVFEVDTTGNLDTLRVAVALRGVQPDVLVLSGKVRNNDLVVTARGPIPLLNWTRRFPYQPRQVVQNELSPLDRLPGLQVGQRWRVQSVSPLTGQVIEAQVAVERKCVISWDGNPVTTHEVVTRVPALAGLPPTASRTWVRSDGLVLRQELPLPLVRLKVQLERLPERFLGSGVWYGDRNGAGAGNESR